MQDGSWCCFVLSQNQLQVTGSQLFNYIKAYTDVFSTSSAFPEVGVVPSYKQASSSLTLVAAAQAKTLLEATADANNKNAQDVALKKYKAEMEQVSIEAVLLDMLLTHPLQVAGVGKRYCEPSRLDDRHDSFKVSCMEYFGVLPR